MAFPIAAFSAPSAYPEKAVATSLKMASAARVFPAASLTAIPIALNAAAASFSPRAASATRRLNLPNALATPSRSEPACEAAKPIPPMVSTASPVDLDRSFR